jgi:hypothetical protein
MRKVKDPQLDPDQDPYLLLMDPDPGGPKTCGSCGSGSPTLVSSYAVVSNTFSSSWTNNENILLSAGAVIAQSKGFNNGWFLNRTGA